MSNPQHSIPYEKIVETNAHEGPVCLWQNRLYFTTKPDLTSHDPQVSIRYLDLSDLTIHDFIEDANMANSMVLSQDGKSLLVAEQGTLKSPGGITKINLVNKEKESLVNNFEGKPFNSPNKVIQNKAGIIYFSDPDYGYNQGFKNKPVLDNAVYAFDPHNRKLYLLTKRFEMPHGLALNNDESDLLVGDTSAVNGKDPYDATKTHNLNRVHLVDDFHAGEITPLVTADTAIYKFSLQESSQ